MQNRIVVTTLVALAVGLSFTSGVTAQHVRPEGTFFIKPSLGISTYLGDNEASPLNLNGDAFSVAFPWMVGAEIGYQRSVPFSISGALIFGDYPVITQYTPPPYRSAAAVADDPSVRTTLAAIGRYTFAGPEDRSAFYMNFGIVYSFGSVVQNDMVSFSSTEDASAFGPLVGAGVDFTLNLRTSFFAEYNAGLHFGDDQLDGTADGGFGGVDVLGGLGIGLKYNMKAAVTPPKDLTANCPADPVVAGQEVAFSTMLNRGITQPVEVTWDFGDGGSASGSEVMHAFADGGVYNVTYSASNMAGEATSAPCQVTVQVAAEIVTATASRNSVSICDADAAVSFSANVRGDSPMTYSWDFGDGNTSDSPNPSHTFGELGTYEVTLTLTNVAGSDQSTIAVTVTDEGCFNCDISAMNSVFFERNSSVLTPEGLEELTENLEILQNCTFNARVEGHAAFNERNSMGLSEDRARAVMQYYVDNGIDEARLTTVGLGSTAQTTKKSGASEFQRVDTIPVGDGM